MVTISKTINKIVIEEKLSYIHKYGFDSFWDDIREVYPESIYKTEIIEKTTDKKRIIIVLNRKDIIQLTTK